MTILQGTVNLMNDIVMNTKEELDRLKITTEIEDKAIELGYDLCKIIPAVPFSEFTHYLNKRIKDFPDSRHLYEHLHHLAFPSENNKSIIVCIRRYNQYKIPQLFDKLIGKVYLFDGRLEYSKEYQREQDFNDYLCSLGISYEKDTVSARWAAEIAGLGFFGRNNFIYTEFGSYVWIHTWEVNVELCYDFNKETRGIKCLCNDKCRKCIDACPTHALSDDFSMDRGKCIAHLSFNAKEIQPEYLRDEMGMWIYGCDICQDACPMNKNKLEQSNEFPLMSETEENITLEKILTMDEKYFTNILQPRFWYINKEEMWLWKCNALRAMANSGDEKFKSLIISSCDNEDSRVREMAIWACKKLGIQPEST